MALRGGPLDVSRWRSSIATGRPPSSPESGVIEPVRCAAVDKRTVDEAGRRRSLESMDVARRCAHEPAVRSCRHKPGVVDLFVSGSDNALWTKRGVDRRVSANGTSLGGLIVGATGVAIVVHRRGRSVRARRRRRGVDEAGRSTGSGMTGRQLGGIVTAVNRRQASASAGRRRLVRARHRQTPVWTPPTSRAAAWTPLDFPWVWVVDEPGRGDLAVERHVRPSSARGRRQRAPGCCGSRTASKARPTSMGGAIQ